MPKKPPRGYCPVNTGYQPILNKKARLKSIDDHIKELCKTSPAFKEAYLAEKKRITELTKIIENYTKPLKYSLKNKTHRVGLALAISLLME